MINTPSVLLANQITKLWSTLHSCSNIRENSIASLKNAVAAGADIVEFDVQISKDLVPVIYHNFELITSVAKRKGGGIEYITLPLKSLTLAQLQALKVCQLINVTLHRLKAFLAS